MMLRYLLKLLDMHGTNEEEFQPSSSGFLYFNCFIDGCVGNFMLEGACCMLKGWPFDLIVLILVVLLMCLVDFVPLKAADSVVSVCVSEDVSDRVTV